MPVPSRQSEPSPLAKAWYAATAVDFHRVLDDTQCHALNRKRGTDLGDWSKGGLLGSLRKRVAREVKEHQKTNAALLSARAPMSMRVLQSFFGERGLFGFLIPYFMIVISLLIVELGITRGFRPVIPQWNMGGAGEFPSIIPPLTHVLQIEPLLREVTSYFLGAQVVMIGLLFPIAVALVTMIVQREDASSTISDVQVYYSETLAYRIGASGLALSIVLAVQLLWPAQFAAYRFGLATSTEVSKIFLTGIHLLWMVINFASLWHFLSTSLSFVRPADRALLRRRFAANIAIPRALFDRYSRALYAAAGSSLLPESDVTEDSSPSIFFGSSFGEWGVVEVAKPGAAQKILVDVWMTPLGWVLRRWWKRCEKQLPQLDQYTRHIGPALVFVPEIGRSLPEDAVICRRNNGVPLSRLEQLAVRASFRFSKRRP